MILFLTGRTNGAKYSTPRSQQQAADIPGKNSFFCHIDRAIFLYVILKKFYVLFYNRRINVKNTCRFQLHSNRVCVCIYMYAPMCAGTCARIFGGPRTILVSFPVMIDLFLSFSFLFKIVAGIPQIDQAVHQAQASISPVLGLLVLVLHPALHSHLLHSVIYPFFPSLPPAYTQHLSIVGD